MPTDTTLVLVSDHMSNILISSMQYTIYCHVNLLNGKRYVGQTERTVQKRWMEHCKSSLDYPFQRALKKYGQRCWAHIVLEIVSSKDEANQREKWWISRLMSKRYGYNVSDGGSGGALSKEIREKVGAKLRGKPKSKTHRARIGLAHLGMKRSQQAKQNMSKNHANFKGENHPNVKLTREDAEFIKRLIEDTDINVIAKRFNVSTSTIRNIRDGKHWSQRSRSHSPLTQPSS